MNQSQQTLEKDFINGTGFNEILTEEELHAAQSQTSTAPSPLPPQKNGSASAIPPQPNHQKHTFSSNGPAMELAPMKESSRNRFIHVPALIEVSASLSWAILVTSGVIIGLISFKSGIRGLEFFLRTGSAVFLAGMLLIAFNWILAQGSYDIHKEKLEREKREMENAELFEQEIDEDEDEEDEAEEDYLVGDETEENQAESE